MTRRKREPDARALLRFVADHEALGLTVDEFPELGEERIRALLRELAGDREASPRGTAAGRQPAATDAKTPIITGTGRAPSASSVVLRTDGASRGNPGPAGAGWILESASGHVLQRGNAFLGRRTNNEAEYEAVIHGLAAALELGALEVALRADSELLIKQLNGEYQVRNERIAVLHERARALIGRLRRLDARHVRREQNALADALANEAIDRGGPPSP